MPEFQLHPQLARDSHLIGDMRLSRALLLDDSRYPWVILVPRRPDVGEIYELATADRRILLEESCRTGEFLVHAFSGHKLNVATLGNLVPQLHVHHVVRQVDDPAWPGPVWGHSTAVPYAGTPLRERLEILRRGLPVVDC